MAIVKMLAVLLVVGSMQVLASGQESVAIPRPQIADAEFSIAKYGATSDGKTKCTQAIVQAIEACQKAGGGVVVIPPGRWLTGAFAFGSNTNLRIDKGATLAFTNDPADYADPHSTSGRFANCISANGAHNIAITGAGTIDGQGEFWWKNFYKPKNAPADVPTPPHRPHLITLRNCQRVLVQGVTLLNSPNFHLVPEGCTDVTIDSVNFNAPERAPNTDGLDPSGWNYLITRCTFDVGDDCIAVKATGKGKDGKPSCGNFTITDCTFMHGHGLSIGGQTPGGLRGMTVRHCTFNGTDAGIRMKASRGAGGLVEDLVYDDLSMKNVKVAILITSYYPKIPKDVAQDPSQKVTDKTPVWKNIRMSNVRAEGGVTAGQIVGLPEMPVENIELNNVHLSADKGIQIVNAKGISFVNSSVKAKTGPAVTELHNAQVTGLNP